MRGLNGVEALSIVRRQGRGIELRAVPGFPGYMASETGYVYSLSRFHGGLRRMKPFANDDGYLQIELFVEGKRKYMRVHRLVALAFLGEPPADKPETRHLDGNQKHNHYTNLAFGTRLQNMEDRARHGRNPKGTKNGRAKVDETDVGEIRRFLLDGISASALARSFHLEKTTVLDIGRGKLWPDVPAATHVRPKSVAVVREHAAAHGSGISWDRRKRMLAALDGRLSKTAGGIAMTPRDARLEDIRTHPERHRHAYEELMACCFVDGAIDCGIMQAHENVDLGENGGVKCDVWEGPCACSAWHHVDPITGERT